MGCCGSRPAPPEEIELQARPAISWPVGAERDYPNGVTLQPQIMPLQQALTADHIHQIQRAGLPTHVHAPPPPVPRVPSPTVNLYMVVFEHHGEHVEGYPHQFFRHCVLALRHDEARTDVFHLQGTPGVRLRYRPHSTGTDNVFRAANRIAAIPIVHLPPARYNEFEDLLHAVEIQVSHWWNGQDWVREGLDAMEQNGMLTAHEKYVAIREQCWALNSPRRRRHDR